MRSSTPARGSPSRPGDLDSSLSPAGLPPAAPERCAWLRALLLLAVGGAWAFAAWMAGNVSAQPAVMGRWSKAYAGFVAGLAGIALLLTLAHTGPLFRRLARARRGILAGLLGTVGALGLAEGLVRLLDPLQISSLEEVQRYDREAKIPDPEISYRSRPGMRATFQGVEIAINEMGFRDRPVGPKAQGEFRLLVLGDSVTFGWGVEAPETYPRRLETLLAARLGRSVRALNTGCDSYDTADERAVLERYGEPFAPDLVVLLYVTNDVELKPHPWDPGRATSIAGRSPPEALNLLLWRSWLYRGARFVLRLRRGEAAQAPDRESVGWKRSMEALRGIAGRCRDRRTPFALFLYRMRPDRQTDALREDLAAVGAAEGFAVTDVLPWFSGADLRAHCNSVVDSHPNARGHRVLAEGMDRTLAELGLLPR